jgi:methyl-accepting chemotaxis protein
MFKNLSFRTKLIMPLVLIGLVMVVIAVVGIRSNASMKETVNEVTKRYLPGVDYLLQADRDLYQALTAERSFVFMQPGTDAYKEQVDSHAENIQQAKERVEKFAELVKTDQVNALMTTFRTRFDDWEQLTHQIVQAKTEGGSAGQDQAIQMSFGIANDKFSEMRDVIDQLTEITETSAENTSQQIDALASSSEYKQMTSLFVGVVICGLIAIFVPLMITRPINTLLARVEDISRGEGDLTARLEINSKDEVGKLGEAFNNFLAKLHSIIGSIAGSTQQLASAAEELSLITAESATNMQQQHSATDQVATAITEMSATVQEVARNASDAAAAATDADRNVYEGQEVVQKTIGAITDLAQDVDNAAHVIRELSTNSDSIGKVLDVIKGIAEQTNLLALNAAIEAARAGEQGRGFAVVADEVRTLASRTQESTQEIQEMIEKLQEGAGNAVKVMETGCTKAQTTVTLAENAGAALKAITTAVNDISQMNVQIATAAEEQNAVTEDINRNVVNISSVSDSTAEASSQIETATSSLAVLAAELQQQVDQFRI